MANDRTEIERSSKAQSKGERRSPWTIIPKGWVAVLLMVLAWVALFLILRGLALLP